MKIHAFRILKAVLLAGCISTVGPFAATQMNLAGYTAHADGKSVGLDERRNRAQLRRWLGIDPMRTSWCGAYLAARLRGMGKSVPPNAASVSSWRRWGRSVKPRPGVVAVFRHNHVGLVVAIKPGCVLVTSGNDNDAVRTRCRRPSTIASYRWN